MSVKIVQGQKHLTQEEERAGTAHPGEEKAHWGSYQPLVYILLGVEQRRQRQTFLCHAWCQDRRQKRQKRRHKFKYRKFHLNVSKIKILYCMVVKHWRRPPRDVVTSSVLEDTQNQDGHDLGRPASWSSLSSDFGLGLQRWLPNPISLWFCDFSVISDFFA